VFIQYYEYSIAWMKSVCVGHHRRLGFGLCQATGAGRMAWRAASFDAPPPT
jgi:hypothetical protein